MMRAKIFLPAVVGLVQAACAAVQDDPGPARDGAAVISPWRIGAGYHFWATDLDVTTTTATERVELDASVVQGVQLAAEYRLSRRVDVRLAFESGLGLDLHTLGASLGASCSLDELPDPWESWLHASLLYATLEIDGLRGDFKGALGFEAGVGFARPVGDWARGIHLRAELAARWLEFDFDPDPGAASVHDTVGGFGGRLLLGLDWRF
jgi:hypothetical protein